MPLITAPSLLSSKSGEESSSLQDKSDIMGKARSVQCVAPTNQETTRILYITWGTTCLILLKWYYLSRTDRAHN